MLFDKPFGRNNRNFAFFVLPLTLLLTNCELRKDVLIVYKRTHTRIKVEMWCAKVTRGEKCCKCQQFLRSLDGIKIVKRSNRRKCCTRYAQRSKSPATSSICWIISLICTSKISVGIAYTLVLHTLRLYTIVSVYRAPNSISSTHIFFFFFSNEFRNCKSYRRYADPRYGRAAIIEIDSDGKRQHARGKKTKL